MSGDVWCYPRWEGKKRGTSIGERVLQEGRWGNNLAVIALSRRRTWAATTKQQQPRYLPQGANFQISEPLG